MEEVIQDRHGFTEAKRIELGISPSEKIEKLSDQWASPDRFMKLVHHLWRPALDVCATSHNKKCSRFIAPVWSEEDTIKNGCLGHDAFSMPWVTNSGQPATAYCNPPYSRIQPWVERAVEQAIEHRTKTIFLVLNAISTKWFEIAEQSAQRIYLLRPRIPFEDPNTNTNRNSPRGDNMLMIFDHASAKMKGGSPITILKWIELCEKLGID